MNLLTLLCAIDLGIHQRRIRIGKCENIPITTYSYFKQLIIFSLHADRKNHSQNKEISSVKTPTGNNRKHQ